MAEDPQLDPNQTLVATIADFNLWDYEMTNAQLLNLSCTDQGNIVNMDTLLISGETKLRYADYTCPGM